MGENAADAHRKKIYELLDSAMATAMYEIKLRQYNVPMHLLKLEIQDAATRFIARLWPQIEDGTLASQGFMGEFVIRIGMAHCGIEALESIKKRHDISPLRPPEASSKSLTAQDTPQ